MPFTKEEFVKATHVQVSRMLPCTHHSAIKWSLADHYCVNPKALQKTAEVMGVTVAEAATLWEKRREYWNGLEELHSTVDIKLAKAKTESA